MPALKPKPGLTPDGKFVRKEKNLGALLSVDHAGLAAYKLQKKRQADLNKMMAEHETVKTDVAEIKTMLAAILEKLK